jgi:hypothetical protein
MASRYGVTPESVRLKLGVGTSAISDDDVTTMIEESEYEAERILKTKFIPTTETQWKTRADGSNVMMLNKTPVCRILEVQVGGTEVTPKYVKVNRHSGRAVLTDDAEETEWSDDEDKDNFIRYNYGRLDETTTSTALSSVATASDSAAVLSVGTTQGFDTNDYVMIIGTGTASWIGQDEITKVTGTSRASNTITVEGMQYDKGIGTRVIKLTPPEEVKMLIRILSALRGGQYMIGNTYTFATSYTIPEMSVTKGVPYPHFEKVYNSLLKARDDAIMRIRPEFAIG